MALDEEFITLEEFQAKATAEAERKPPEISMLRYLFSIFLILAGCSAIVFGVALIYWKAAIILAGAVMLVGAFQIDVSKPGTK